MALPESQEAAGLQGPSIAARVLAAMRRVALSRQVDVIARTVAAIAGGYVFSAILATVMAVALPFPRAQAVITGMLVAILAYAGVVIWAFSVRSPLKLWAWLVGLSAAGAIFLMIQQGPTAP